VARLTLASGGLVMQRFLGWGSIALGLGIAVQAVLGPLVLGLIEHRAEPSTVSQVVGGDAAALVVIAPVAIVAGVLALRRHRAAPLLVMGPGVYAAYTAFQLAVGQEHLRLPGNVEHFFPLYLGLMVLGGALTVAAWVAVDAAALPHPSRRLRRWVGGLLLGVSGFLVLGLHLPGLLDAWRALPTAEEYLAGPTPFWVVKAMDLGLVVPVAVTVGIGLLREAPWARKPAYAIVSWCTFLGASVAGMGIMMVVDDAYGASLAMAVPFTAFALAAAAFMVALYRPLFQAPATTPAGGTRAEAPTHAPAPVP
jgi:hypothetical protein